MLAYETAIAVSATETKAIQAFRVRDTVLAAGLTRDWKPASIEYAGGVPPGMPYPAIRLTVEGGRSLIGMGDQMLLTAKGLRPLTHIVPGDQLIQADGQSALVSASIIEMFSGGEQAIATSFQPTANPEGHLLIAQGFVVADYMLSIGLVRGARNTLDDSTESARSPA